MELRLMRFIDVALALALVACGAKEPPKSSAAPAASTAPAASRSADCAALREPLHRAQDATKLAQQPADHAVENALQALQQVATDLPALQLHDPAVRKLADDYAALTSEQHALLAEMAPLMAKFGAAVATSNQTAAADQADLASCDGEKKPSKACEAKRKAASEHAARNGAAAADAEAEVRAALKNPALVERNRRINERDAALVEQLHAVCGPLHPDAP